MLRACIALFALSLAACAPATLTAESDPMTVGGPDLPAKNPGEQAGPSGDAERPPGGGSGRGQDRPPPPPAEPQPELEVTAPARGARALGQSLRVQGVVHHAEAPTVTVNGIEAEVGADGGFFVDVPVGDGLAVLQTELQDGSITSVDHRAVLVNADQEPASEVRDAIKVGVSAQGFRTITDIIANGAGDLDLGALLGGAGGGGDVAVRDIRYDRVELSLEPDWGTLKLNLKVYGLRLDVTDPMEVVATANPAEITAYIELLPDGNGSMSLNIADANVGLHDFGFDVDGLPGFLEDLLDWPVREFAEDMLRDALTDVVMPSLFDPAALNQEIDLLGLKLLLGLSIDTVFIDPQGMELGLSASAVPDVVTNPGKAVRPLGGPDGAVAERELDIALAADFVNRIMHAAWASGGLDLALGGEDSAVELPINLTAGLLLGALGEAGQGVNPAAPVLIGTRALLPPVITLVEGERPMRVEVGDFLLDLSTPDALLVSLAVHMTIELGIGFDDAGELALDFELSTHVDVAEEPRGRVNRTALETLVGGILGQLPNMLAEGLAAEDAEPMPASPINLANADFQAVGAFLHILADIDANPIAPQPVP